jgi:hypothetical protein
VSRLWVNDCILPRFLSQLLALTSEGEEEEEEEEEEALWK